MSAAERHEQAQRGHQRAAKRHEQSVAFWTEKGDPERAELERRAVVIERDAAELEGDKALLARSRVAAG